MRIIQQRRNVSGRRRHDRIVLFIALVHRLNDLPAHLLCLAEQTLLILLKQTVRTNDKPPTDQRPKALRPRIRHDFRHVCTIFTDTEADTVQIRMIRRRLTVGDNEVRRQNRIHQILIKRILLNNRPARPQLLAEIIEDRQRLLVLNAVQNILEHRNLLSVHIAVQKRTVVLHQAQRTCHITLITTRQNF